MKAEVQVGWLDQVVQEFKALCVTLQEEICVAADGTLLDSGEKTLQKGMQQLAIRVKEHLVQQQIDSRTQTERFIVCERCGQRMRHRGHHSRSFVTRFGHIRLRGPYRYCRCGNSHTLTELVGGCRTISSGILELILRYTATMPMGVASMYLREDFGVSVSDEYLRLVSLDYGQKVCGLRDRQNVSGRWQLKDQDLYGYADGTMVNIRQEGWKECKLVRYQAAGSSKRRLRGVIGSGADFGRMLRREAVKVGASEAARLTFVMDAAGGLANQVSKNLPMARQVVDYWHACQHIADCSGVLYGPVEKKGQVWRSEHCRMLREGGPGVLLEALGRACWRFRKRGKLRAITELMGFIERHRGRLEYPTFVAEGLKIDSGPIESSCKTVVGQRLKGPGMRWSRPGANSILELRTALYSDLWNDVIRALTA